jgi:hypothetical protein
MTCSRTTSCEWNQGNKPRLRRALAVSNIPYVAVFPGIPGPCLVCHLSFPRLLSLLSKVSIVDVRIHSLAGSSISPVQASTSTVVGTTLCIKTTSSFVEEGMFMSMQELEPPTYKQERRGGWTVRTCEDWGRSRVSGAQGRGFPLSGAWHSTNRSMNCLALP